MHKYLLVQFYFKRSMMLILKSKYLFEIPVGPIYKSGPVWPCGMATAVLSKFNLTICQALPASPFETGGIKK
jgi:hypothetical protein